MEGDEEKSKSRKKKEEQSNMKPGFATKTQAPVPLQKRPRASDLTTRQR